MKTKEKAVNGYIKEKHNQDECIGFIDGYTQCQEDMLKEELKDWDVTLNDGLENEPYVSDDFQIGPNRAYEHTEDMRKISKIYQNVIFSLYGNGEEDGDMWVKYFMNGKVQTEDAVITYADFDPKKLMDRKN